MPAMLRPIVGDVSDQCQLVAAEATMPRRGLRFEKEQFISHAALREETSIYFACCLRV